MLCSILVIALAVPSVSVAAAELGPNLAKNGGFEQALAGWQPLTIRGGARTKPARH